MDAETRAQLFGRNSKLTKRAWAVGQRKVLFIEKTSQAVVATMEKDTTLLVDGKRTFGLDPNLSYKGRPVYVLIDATRRLESEEKVSSTSAVHGRAIELSKVFGTTYYLSESVVTHLMPGHHFFAVGKSPAQRLHYEKFSLDGKTLTWSSGPVKYAMLGKRPVFVLFDVGRRVTRAKNDKCSKKN